MSVDILKISYAPSSNLKLDHALVFLATSRKQITQITLLAATVKNEAAIGTAVSSPYKKKYMDSLEKVQRRATRMLPGMAYKGYEERLRMLGIPSLTYRRLRGDVLEMFKMTSCGYDQGILPDLVFVGDSTTRGHSKKLFHRRSSKQCGRTFHQ